MPAQPHLPPPVPHSAGPVAAQPIAGGMTLLERSAALATVAARSNEQEQNSRSTKTQKLYAGDWRHFEAFCRMYELPPLPAEPDTVRLYLTDMSMQVHADGSFCFSPATMSRRLAAIGHEHKKLGLEGFGKHPRIAPVLAGIRRERTVRQRRMEPLLLDDVRTLLDAMDFLSWPDALYSARDSFVLLAGFAGAFRRSEVAVLNFGQVTHHRHDGLHVRLLESKTDQGGHGATIALPYGQQSQTCPPCAWMRWALLLRANEKGGRPALMKQVYAGLPETGPAAGEHICRSFPRIEVDDDAPLVRAIRRGGHLGEEAVTGHALHNMIKRRAAASGYDTTEIGFHSLRAGFVTQARRNGADARSIRLQTRHGSDAMVDVYDREYIPLAGGNAVLKLGL